MTIQYLTRFERGSLYLAIAGQNVKHLRYRGSAVSSCFVYVSCRQRVLGV
ncbi:MAG: hypothetical protein ABW047_06820 [Nitrospiraceae bacterium]